ncbi:hypothetical protein BC749_103293 [Flavobacterium araucananum]|uniref:hypothetical protein n=1 Tax=Flavobacterium araucananum TaxID=946678 RepID=UPI000D6D13D3|nr:hypothetical protein [Flavobacterium araucananum]PWJ99912.1 hypothetical protein BC749_103293 [Flavobacterium araucananum]
MKLKIIIIVLSLFYFSGISQNVKQDSCQLYFKEIGIRDFILGSNYTEFAKESKTLKRKFQRETFYGIDIITFNENTVLLKANKTIEYNLKFKDNVLMSYTFKINIGNFRKAPDYYEKVLKLLDENKNKNYFIKKGGYSFMKKTKKCTKFFDIISSENESQSIYGGISYESSIWEQQFKDYMNDIGKDKE